MNPALMLLMKSAGVPRLLTYRGYADGTTSQATFTGLPIGTASATRSVIVGVAWTTSGVLRYVTAATIGGVAATIEANSGSTTAGSCILRATVPTGETADVVLTWSSTGATPRLGVWTAASGLTLAGYATHYVTDISTNALTVSPTAAAGAGVIAQLATRFTLTGIAWTGATERHATAAGANADWIATAGTCTVSVTTTPNPINGIARLSAATYVPA